MIEIKYIEKLLFLTYLIFVILGIKEFTIWSQITDILVPNDMELNIDTIIGMIATNHPHTLRVMLITPFYIISEYFNYDIKLFFSIVLVILIFITYWVNVSILEKYIARKKLLFFLIFLIALSSIMNGRILFSILGNTVLLLLLYNNFYVKEKFKWYKNIFLFIVSLCLVSVSSGTFTVFLFTIFIFYILQNLVQLPYISKKILWMFILFILMILLILPVIIVFIEKNLNYYDGSVLQMLSHGAGGYLLEYFYLIFPILSIFILLLPIGFFYIKRNNFLILPLSMIISSITIGLFGYSSLVSGISAYLIFIYMFIYTKRYKSLQYV